MKLKVSQVIGLNTDQKAAQVISSISGDGAFFALLELVCDDAFTKGRQALSEISDFYFSAEGTIAEKLTATFKEAEQKFSSQSFSLVVTAVSGKVLYLIFKGNVEAYLKRDNKLSSLLSVGGETQLISGFLQEEDRLLLTNKNLVSFLHDDLSKILNLPLDSFEEEISARISSSDLEEQGLAGLLMEAQAELDETAIPAYPSSEEQPILSDYTGEKAHLLKNTLVGFGRLIKRGVRYFPKSGRGRLIVAIVLIIIIGSGVGVKIKASKDAQKETQFSQALMQAKDSFNAAQGLATLNPTEAKNRLNEATDNLNKALALRPQDQEAQDLKKQIEQDSSSILKEAQVSQFPLFLDLDLIKKNFRANYMSLSAGKLLILDPSVKTLVSVDIAKKSNQVLAGSEQLGESGLASLNGSLAFIYSKDKGVLRIDTTNSKLSTVAKKDSDLEDVKDIYGFASNIYLLEGNIIWKYLPTTDGYSDKREYLTKETTADFSNVLRMQIESSVYVLKDGGEILRFTRGEKDHFSLGGLDKGVKNPKSFFVSSDTDNLYILDSGNSRVLIVSKTGEYKGQMAGDKFGSASDLTVDEEGKKIYLLDGGKIYSVDLK